MTKSRKNPKVDVYLSKTQEWRPEQEKLRGILLDHPLDEALKWAKPCYAFEGSNVAIIIPLKESCALMFCKGALLKDTKGLLSRPGENTQSGRWIKFTAVREIAAKKAVLNAYIDEAIAAEKAGLKIQFKKTSEFKMPEELRKKLEKTPALKAAFAALTPGRQRGYLLHFSAPKQAKTREARIEKCAPQILAGLGLNDR
jgi:uncharacterized protein YdeI (YjbR/CyaY-like superfamily)